MFNHHSEQPGRAAAWTRPFRAPPDPGHRPGLPGLADGGALQGVPLGGIGTGGIGRDWRGSFGRWTLVPGTFDHHVEPVNGFSLFQQPDGGPASALPLGPPPGDDRLAAWDWPDSVVDGTYRAMYPKAWYEYPSGPERPVAAVCEQFSPVIPGDAEASTLPVAAFRWHLHNTGSSPVKVGLLFTFQHLAGRLSPGSAAPETGLHATPLDGQAGVPLGVSFETERPVADGFGQAAIAACPGAGVTITRRLAFDGAGDGADVWGPFRDTGMLGPDPGAWTAGVPGGTDRRPVPSAAVAATTHLAPGRGATVVFGLAWDLPVIRFGSGRRHLRRHTRVVGADGTNAARLIGIAGSRVRGWGTAIDRWHEALVAAAGPEHAAFLCNELYLLAEGATVWTEGAPDGSAGPFFGVLECPDYPFYDTLDLWTYGGWPLAAMWPEADRIVVEDYAAAVIRDDPRPRLLGRGLVGRVSVRGAAPHDLGSPHADPGVQANAYSSRDPNRWKDLNSHFVLASWRHVARTGDLGSARRCLPAVEAALDHLAAFDRDGDGLIEHEGDADHTFEDLPMSGVSAYCGGLWIAALEAAAAIAGAAGREDLAAAWRGMRRRASGRFEEIMWTGTHYRFDTEGPHPGAVFAEQLFGPWFAERCGLEPVVDPGRARRALATVIERNRLADGTIATLTGAAEGQAEAARWSEGGSAPQAAEVVIGINLSVANQLDHYGLSGEAAGLRAAVRRGVYEERGLWFRTPAVWTPGDRFGAVMNLRPLVVWAGLSDGEIDRVLEAAATR